MAGFEATGSATNGAGDYQSTGFLRPGLRAQPPRPTISFDRARQQRLRVVAMDTIGIESYFAGPDFHVVDVLGLADPLLSRLPAVGTWRVGHYCRDQPAGTPRRFRVERTSWLILAWRRSTGNCER